jgi:diguanylate cyclase (GGDEF)-like protein/PAS domain S-box-containing protein
LRARLLAAILSLLVPVALLFTILVPLTTRGISFDFWLAVAALVFTVLVWASWHILGLNAASVFLALGSAAITSIGVFYSGGIASSVLAAQMLVVAVAGLVTRPRVTLLVVTALTIFNFSVIYFVQLQQLAGPVLSTTPLIRFFTQTSILLVCAGVIVYSNSILRALTLKLVSSEYRFRALFEQTSDAVFITGLDLRLIEANAQAARILAYEPKELVGLPVQNLFPRDEWPEEEERFEAVKKSDVMVPATRRFVTKSGEELMLETNLSLVQDADGKPLHYQSTGRDVTQRVVEEQRMKSTLAHLVVKASTDSLTGILNRESILQHARAEWERYAREGHPMSLMLVDMDGLKHINDTMGHNTGDQALTALVRVIDKLKRPYDWFGRYGGDEFMVVLPGASHEDAQAIARRMQAAIHQESVNAGRKQVTLSCSFGVVSTDGHQPAIGSISQLIELADAQLYKGKRRPFAPI